MGLGGVGGSKPFQSIQSGLETIRESKAGKLFKEAKLPSKSQVKKALANLKKENIKASASNVAKKLKAIPHKAAGLGLMLGAMASKRNSETLGLKALMLNPSMGKTNMLKPEKYADYKREKIKQQLSKFIGSCTKSLGSGMLNAGGKILQQVKGESKLGKLASKMSEKGEKLREKGKLKRETAEAKIEDSKREIYETPSQKQASDVEEQIMADYEEQAASLKEEMIMADYEEQAASIKNELAENEGISKNRNEAFATFFSNQIDSISNLYTKELSNCDNLNDLTEVFNQIDKRLDLFDEQLESSKEKGLNEDTYNEIKDQFNELYDHLQDMSLSKKDELENKPGLEHASKVSVEPQELKSSDSSKILVGEEKVTAKAQKLESPDAAKIQLGEENLLSEEKVGIKPSMAEDMLEADAVYDLDADIPEEQPEIMSSLKDLEDTRASLDKEVDLDLFLKEQMEKNLQQDIGSILNNPQKTDTNDLPDE